MPRYGCTCRMPEAASPSSTSSGNDASASGDNVIKIGVFEPETGENGGGGLQEVYGIRLTLTRFILQLRSAEQNTQFSL